MTALPAKVLLTCPERRNSPGLVERLAAFVGRARAEGVKVVAVVGPDGEWIHDAIDGELVGDVSVEPPPLLTTWHDSADDALAFLRLLPEDEYPGDTAVVQIDPPPRGNWIAPSRTLSGLVEIMARLRDPVTGCPWDKEQDFSTIRHYTVEEAYEVADAIERGDFDDLREELGDLILQPVYHAQMAAEAGLFDIGDVIEAITTKLIRRHPHVFGEAAARTAGGAKAKWEEIKADERSTKAARRGTAASILDDVPGALPQLSRAEKLARRAASVGFDWPDTASVVGKVREELSEAEAAIASGDAAHVHEELGDLLMAVANLARHAGVDPEAALRDANAKFVRRFHHVEARADEEGVPLAEAGLAQLDGYWNEIRAREKVDSGVEDS